MWKRLNRTLDREIGNPTLIETTVDQKTLNGSTSLNAGDFSISSRPAFGRRKTDDVLKGLPELPRRSFQNLNTYSAPPLSEWPTASSNYSKLSPTTARIHPPAESTPAASLISKPSSANSNEISPPESPRTSDAPRSSSGQSSYDVSPVTESPKPSTNHFLRVYPQVSNVPVVLRSQKYEDWENPPSDWRSTGPIPPNRDSASTFLTNWDDFSAEPTTSETEKPAQTSSGVLHVELGAIARESKIPLRFNAAIGIGSGQDPTNISIRQSNPSFIPKEAWKGANGRHTIVNPPCDKPLPPGKRPSFPRGTQNASESSRDLSTGMICPASFLPPPIYRKPVGAPINLTSHVLMGTNEDGGPSPVQVIRSPVTDIPMSLPRYPGIRSSQPNTIPSDIHDPHSPSSAFDGKDAGTSVNGDGFSPSKTVTSSIPLAQMQLTPSILDIDRFSSYPKQTVNSKKYDQKPHLIPPDFTPTKMRSGLDLEAIENDFRAKMHHMHLEDQPPSRFSATTCATTLDSPPATPEMSSNSPTPPSTILNRKRPVAATSISNPKVTSHKPGPQAFKNSSRIDPGNVRLSKSLPKSPPEAQAVTRVASLEAKLENLRRRRSNLRMVIQERTNVVQPNSNDMASRHETKRTVDGLYEELAEVIKDEHETGLQLHRAWKREDTDSAYENSSLWVKRLAS